MVSVGKKAAEGFAFFGYSTIKPIQEYNRDRIVCIELHSSLAAGGKQG